MLQLKNICKEYRTGELVQKALDDVSLSLRESELVAILGPSGSGKTTLLNVIGGLDRYDSGDLIIRGVSTKKYRDRDWDAYRNHTIGFVFQSYNLIPHQSILANVELALTISGVSLRERRQRAKKALQDVGLGDQCHKRPHQLSGGQMQRVAIARALVNDPAVLLADEPTGALDSETSVQVLELLKEVSRTRLVVMVTHNAELAEEYATRTVKLKDGRIVDDTNPYAPALQDAPEHRRMGRASMSFLTSLSLSFNNLRTKKGRTLLTAFAGSIGIIGISLILALSTGVNGYIADIQKSTMTSYPISIEAQAMDLAGMLDSGPPAAQRRDENAHELDSVYSDVSDLELAASMMATVTTNNLTAFKRYLDDPASEIYQYVGENGIIYSYDTSFRIYTHDPQGVLVNTDGSTLEDTGASSAGVPGMGGMMGMSGSSSNFEELMAGADGELVSPAITDSYDVLYGSWPDSYDEVVLVLDGNNEISATALYQLGLLPVAEYKELMQQMNSGAETAVSLQKWSYEEICQQTFYLLPACDLYTLRENGLFAAVEGTDREIEELLASAVELRISGVVRPKENASNASITETIGYTGALTRHIINYTMNSPVMLAQLASPDVNVLTGASFSQTTDSSYEDNLAAFGYVSLDAPSGIDIYADSFEDKEGITDCIASYNQTADEADQISYTDYVALLMSSVTTIVNVISYVLIAFVAVSLVVSSIMIGIITYISVLERTKEIGILRAIGASKRNISQVFSAETFIIGAFAGLLGIGIASLLLIPGNAIIHALTGSSTVNAHIPLTSALLLIALSILLTLIGGYIPSKKASRKDPVTALRSE